jgi:hypothetical protein
MATQAQMGGRGRTPSIPKLRTRRELVVSPGLFTRGKDSGQENLAPSHRHSIPGKVIVKPQAIYGRNSY